MDRMFLKNFEPPQIIHFERVFHNFSPSILGYPYFLETPHMGLTKKKNGQTSSKKGIGYRRLKAWKMLPFELPVLWDRLINPNVVRIYIPVVTGIPY